MKKILLIGAFALLSLGVASASTLPCIISGSSAVNGTTAVICGPLTFDNFEVLNAVGGASGLVYILPSSDYNTATDTAFLQIDPSLLANEDEDLLFEVIGGINQIDLTVGGQNASVTETACANPIAMTGALTGKCANVAGTSSVAPLGLITAATGTIGQPVLSAPFAMTSPVYIFKDIETGPGGHLSLFTESFETPEPGTVMLILGGALIGLGSIVRKRTKS